MKSIEEQIGGRCIHFTGLIQDESKCGISYTKAFGERPALKMPCIKDRMSHLNDEIIPCEKLEFPTAEEVKAQIEKQNKHISLLLTALAVVKKHIKDSGENRGTIQCPHGDHKLSYTRAESNGHVWMACKVCDIKMME